MLYIQHRDKLESWKLGISWKAGKDRQAGPDELELEAGDKLGS